MAEPLPEIGELRWPMTLFRRPQRPDAAAGIAEADEAVATVWGKIENVRTMTFWQVNDVQAETPLTHMIWLRWVGFLDNTYAIQVATRLPGGNVLAKTFRVRRVLEIDQAQRIMRLECELERLDRAA